MTIPTRGAPTTLAQIRKGKSNLPDVGINIYSIMSALASECGAVNLGQGFPDFDAELKLKQCMSNMIFQGHNQYAPMPGVLALRQRISDKHQFCHGVRYDPETEITITAGATQAIATTMAALLNPGDEVILLEPAYDSYAPSVRLAGGTPVFVRLYSSDGFAPDWDRVRAAISSRTRAILLNFPNNPTGRVMYDDDLVALERIIDDYGIIPISDEVYEHVVFDGAGHRSVGSSTSLATRSVVISSFAKTLHVTGWKVGYVLAPASLSQEIRKAHQFMMFAVNTPAQHAIASYLLEPNAYVNVADFFESKRRLFVDGMNRSRFRMLDCAGTYFVLADYSDISELDELSFAKKLVREAGVATIPMSAFYQTPEPSRLLRFCFAKSNDTLEQGIKRLARV